MDSKVKELIAHAPTSCTTWGAIECQCGGGVIFTCYKVCKIVDKQQFSKSLPARILFLQTVIKISFIIDLNREMFINVIASMGGLLWFHSIFAVLSALVTTAYFSCSLFLHAFVFFCILFCFASFNRILLASLTACLQCCCGAAILKFLLMITTKTFFCCLELKQRLTTLGYNIL